MMFSPPKNCGLDVDAVKRLGDAPLPDVATSKVSLDFQLQMTNDPLV